MYYIFVYVYIYIYICFTFFLAHLKRGQNNKLVVDAADAGDIDVEIKNSKHSNIASISKRYIIHIGILGETVSACVIRIERPRFSALICARERSAEGISICDVSAYKVASGVPRVA